MAASLLRGYARYHRPHFQILFTVAVLLLWIAVVAALGGHWRDALLPILSAAGLSAVYSTQVAPYLRLGGRMRDAGFAETLAWYGFVAVFVILNLLILLG